MPRQMLLGCVTQPEHELLNGSTHSLLCAIDSSARTNANASIFVLRVTDFYWNFNKNGKKYWLGVSLQIIISPAEQLHGEKKMKKKKKQIAYGIQ